MAEAVVLALGKISISLAGSAISSLREQASIIKELPGKVRRIEAQLSIINGALQQQDSAYLNDNAYMKWIAYIRNLAYQVEDMMDTYSYHAHQLENRGFMWKLTQEYLGPFRSIYEEITKIEESLKHATELKQAWLENYGQQIHLQIGQGVVSLDYIPAEPTWDQDFVRMDDNRRLVTKWLHSSGYHNMFKTLLGEGGLGNTTLATDMYKSEKTKFCGHGFIVVERDSTMDALLRKILFKIESSIEQPPMASIDNIPANELKEVLKRRISKLKDGRCLIVLDNVRDPKIYIEIHDVMSNLPGVRVIVTTRKTQVAAARDRSSRFLQLQPLSTSDAFYLFCRKAFFKMNDSKCPPELEDFATSIVEKCKGLPLAIVTIGGMMSSKPPLEQIWSQMCVRLQNELERNADHVQAVLNLSYHDMPGHLRNCLLYCSMFPEDYHMSRESLVRLWIAEGSVLAANSPRPETIAEEYFMELIRRNMLQVVDNDILGRVSTCKMHDIVRKMITLVAKEERFASAINYSTLAHSDNKDVRHLSLYGWKDKNTPLVKFPRLRRLVALGANSCLTKLLPAIFSGSTFLTVLVLQESDVTEMPTSIGNLFNLRYISLWCTQVKSLPESIQKLSYLDTLDIRQTKILKLPQGIGKARKLRHILADSSPDGNQSDFRSFVALEPPKGLTNFEELQTLETVQANKDMARKLVKMLQLRSISIDNITSTLCAELFASLSELQFLTSLLVSATDENEELSFQNLMPKSSYLSRLTVRGSWSGMTLDYPIFKEHGQNLKYLSLSWCHFGGEDPLHFLGLHCRYLQYLSLHRVQSASSLVLPERCFRELKNLVLEHMPGVTQMRVGDGALQCIEGIYITALPNLDKVPQGIESLSSLKKLFLLNLHNDFIVDWEMSGMNQKMPYGLELRIGS